MSVLLRQGLRCWGASRRIWVVTVLDTGGDAAGRGDF